MKRINRYLVNFDLNKLKREFCDFLIIGSGVAGLHAAIDAEREGDVIIVTKERLDEGNTKYAQGGIAVAIGYDDSPSFHKRDTLKAGDGLSYKKAVDVLVYEGIDRVWDLIELGARFDREGKRLSLGFEAAHSKRRIVHALGDATGIEVERSLIKEVKKRRIKIFENFLVIDLLVKNNQCLGAVVLNKMESKLAVFISAATILATGGAGQVYFHTTNPKLATADGQGAALRAGAELVDLEFFQFHPTALHLPKKYVPRHFLISEAVRGEGVILRNIEGKRFMLGVSKDAELAPRDIVSRAIFQEMRKANSYFVYLDFTHLNPSYSKRRFPHIYKTCREFGLDLCCDLIPVTPSAHYFMGGVKTGLSGETNINRLFACGEVACTGVHGANRLASNSILEGLVFSKRCVREASKYLRLKDLELKNFSLNYKRQKKISELRLSVRGEGEDFLRLRKELQKLMWDNVGIVRYESELKYAIRKIEEFLKILEYENLNQEFIELQNMVLVSYLISKSALLREESRGAHYREDFPYRNDKRWKRDILWRCKDGRFKYTTGNPWG